jgi:type I site-specific restriction endonuclease
MTPPKGPEAEARERIDADLEAAGWKVQTVTRPTCRPAV